MPWAAFWASLVSLTFFLGWCLKLAEDADLTLHKEGDFFQPFTCIFQEETPGSLKRNVDTDLPFGKFQLLVEVSACQAEPLKPPAGRRVLEPLRAVARGL